MKPVINTNYNNSTDEINTIITNKYYFDVECRWSIEKRLTLCNDAVNFISITREIKNKSINELKTFNLNLKEVL